MTQQDSELPGMWESADLIGGETDCPHMTKQDAPTTTDAERADYEKWVLTERPSLLKNTTCLGGDQVEIHVGQIAWIAYQAGASSQAARASSAAAQPGWKLVPIEPTQEQRNAPFVGGVEDQSVTRQAARREDVARVYRTMIAAAPPAPPAKPADTAEASNG